MVAVADLGAKLFSVFLEILAKLYVDPPPPEGWRALLRGILDPPVGRIGRF